MARQKEYNWFLKFTLFLCIFGCFTECTEPNDKKTQPYIQQNQNSIKKPVSTVSSSSSNKNRQFSAGETQNIKFSQTGIRPFTTNEVKINKLSETMKNNQFDWNKSPIVVVEMKKGEFASLDNRRLASAQTAKVGVQAEVYQASDKLPSSQIGRFGSATTYGGAVLQRSRSGSFDASSISNGFTGYPRSAVRIRVKNVKDGEKDLKPFEDAGFVRSPYKREGPYKPPTQDKKSTDSGQPTTNFNLKDSSQFPSLSAPSKSSSVWGNLASSSSGWGTKKSSTLVSGNGSPKSSRPASPVSNIKPDDALSSSKAAVSPSLSRRGSTSSTLSSKPSQLIQSTSKVKGDSASAASTSGSTGQMSYAKVASSAANRRTSITATNAKKKNSRPSSPVRSNSNTGTKPVEKISSSVSSSSNSGANTQPGKKKGGGTKWGFKGKSKSRGTGGKGI